MSNRIAISKCFAVVVLFAGCGDGLASSLGDEGADGGTADEPPTLGVYAKPCDVLGNSQLAAMASFSPTGETVALVVGGPGHVELHATSDGHLVTGFDAHFGLVMDMAFSPKDDLLATTGVDGSLKLWRGGVLVAQRQIFSRPATQLVWSHDGASLVVVDQRGPITLLRVQGNDLATGWSATRQAPGQRPFFSPDDAIVTVGDIDSSPSDTTRMSHDFLVADGSEKSTITPHGYFEAQSPDGSVTAYSDNFYLQITLWRQDTFLWERGFGGPSTGIAFTADSKTVALWGGSTKAPVQLYDVDNGNQLTPLPWATNTPRSILFSPDGLRALVFDYADGSSVRLVDLTSSTSITLASQNKQSDSLGSIVTLSADDTIMASQTWLSSNSFDTALQIWNLSMRQRVSLIPWPFDQIGEPALSAKGDLLYGVELTIQSDHSADVAGFRFECLTDPGATSRWPDGRGGALSLAQDGRTLAIASLDYDTDAQWRIRVVDRLTGAPLNDFSIGPRPTTNIAFLPDGKQIAVLRSTMYAGSTGKDLSIWRVADGRMLFESYGHTQAPRAMAFSPNGSTLALIGDGGPDSPGIDVYDARSWRWIRTLESAYGPRMSVRYSPDGRLMAVSEYGGIRVWRTSDWQSYESFATGRSDDVVFMPDNQSVLEVGTGIIWCAPASP